MAKGACPEVCHQTPDWKGPHCKVASEKRGNKSQRGCRTTPASVEMVFCRIVQIWPLFLSAAHRPRGNRDFDNMGPQEDGRSQIMGATVGELGRCLHAAW